MGCTRCRALGFCSIECRDAANSTYHQYECKFYCDFFHLIHWWYKWYLWRWNRGYSLKCRSVDPVVAFIKDHYSDETGRFFINLFIVDRQRWIGWWWETGQCRIRLNLSPGCFNGSENWKRPFQSDVDGHILVPVPQSWRLLSSTSESRSAEYHRRRSPYWNSNPPPSPTDAVQRPRDLWLSVLNMKIMPILMNRISSLIPIVFISRSQMNETSMRTTKSVYCGIGLYPVNHWIN